MSPKAPVPRYYRDSALHILLPKDLVQMLFHTLKFHKYNYLGEDGCSVLLCQRSYRKFVLQGK